MKFIIREEKEREEQYILSMIGECFINENAALLADLLRKRKEFNPSLSLVAKVNRLIVGYVLLSPIQIQSEQSQIETLWLEPVCVQPSYQTRGIGTALIRRGIEAGKNLGFDSVFVSGNIQYYSQFGFEEANNFGIGSSLYIPSDTFLVRKLMDKSLPDRGQLIFPEEIFG